MSKTKLTPKTENLTPGAESLGNARPIRFQIGVEEEIDRIAKANGMDFPTAVRLIAHFGLPKYRETIGNQGGTKAA